EVEQGARRRAAADDRGVQEGTFLQRGEAGAGGAAAPAARRSATATGAGTAGAAAETGGEGLSALGARAGPAGQDRPEHPAGHEGDADDLGVKDAARPAGRARVAALRGEAPADPDVAGAVHRSGSAPAAATARGQ